MNWNNNDNPWGSNKGGNSWGSQPPGQDLENTIKKYKDRLGRFKLGSPRNFSLFIIAGIIIWLASGFYRVEPDEQGIELLFGKEKQWISL